MSLRMTDDQISQALLLLNASASVKWRIHDKKLQADFKFADFHQAFEFMTAVAQVAQQMNHHPEWMNVYDRLTVQLTTHDAGGLTLLDFQLARAMADLRQVLLHPESRAVQTANTPLPDALRAWVQAFNSADLNAMRHCYANDAVLWGTYATQSIEGRHGVCGYFQQVFDSGRQVQVHVLSHQIRHDIGMQIGIGSCRFVSQENAVEVSAEARFTFVWRSVAGIDQIVSHHSSVMPVPKIT